MYSRVIFFFFKHDFAVFTTLFRGTRRVLRALSCPDRTYEDHENSIVEFSIYGHSNIDPNLTETSSANYEINRVEEYGRELLHV